MKTLASIFDPYQPFHINAFEGFRRTGEVEELFVKSLKLDSNKLTDVESRSIEKKISNAWIHLIKSNQLFRRETHKNTCHYFGNVLEEAFEPWGK